MKPAPITHTLGCTACGSQSIKASGHCANQACGAVVTSRLQVAGARVNVDRLINGRAAR